MKPREAEVSVATLPPRQGPASIAGITGYVPAIDGLRAFSIGLVILSHLFIYGQPIPWLYEVGLDLGEIGVSIFFVVSGYLITGLLLREEDCNAGISLSRFYGRRFLRIFPAAYMFLLVILILKLVGAISVPWHSYLASLFYLRNLIGTGHETSHLWSLAIEEQFYLLWPAALVLCAPVKRLRMAWILVFSVLAWRTFLVFTSGLPFGAVHQRTDVRMDTVLAGCLLALLARTAGFSEWNARFFSRPSSGFAGCLFVALGAWGCSRWSLFASVGYSIIPLGIGMAITYVLQAEHSVLARLLRMQPVIFLGKLSYSLYLWQQLFLGPVEGRIAALRMFPVNLILVFICALASYYLVEKPALRLKDSRFGVRRLHPGAATKLLPVVSPFTVAAQGGPIAD